MRQKTLCQKVRSGVIGEFMESRIVARMDDLNRELTDEEVIKEVKYQLETLPYAGVFDMTDDLKNYRRTEKALKTFLRKYASATLEMPLS